MQKVASQQSTFFEMAMSARGASNRVLETIARLVDFREAEQALEATYSSTGRPGHRVAVLLRVMILQHLYGLSDPQAEEQLKDRLSFQKFAGLQAQEAVPDETAICRFRERLLGARRRWVRNGTTAPSLSGELMALLRIHGGPNSGQSVSLLVGANQVGRGPQNNARFNDGSVSGRHAQIWHDQGRWFVMDLGSTNGTSVDGVAAQRFTLPLLLEAIQKSGTHAIAIRRGDQNITLTLKSRPLV